MFNVNLEDFQYTNINKIKVPIDGTSGNYGEFYATNDADAEPEDVLGGKIFYNSDGQQVGTAISNPYKQGAVGPRIKNENLYQRNMITGLSAIFCNSSQSSGIRTTIINNTNNTAGGNANQYKGVQIVDLGEGYHFILHTSSSSYNLLGTVIYVNQYGVISSGSSYTIGTNYSGIHYSAVALTKRAESLSSLSTNKVLVCYNSNNTNYYLTATIITIDKTNKSISSGGTVNLNNKTFSGCSSMDCALMSFTSISENNNCWYALIGHSSGSANNVSSLYVSVTGIKIQINNNVDTITYGNMATTTIRPGTLTTDGNIRIVRIADNKAGFFFNGDTTTLNLYYAGVVCPNSYVYYSNSISISTPVSLGIAKGGVTFDVLCRTKKIYSNGDFQGDFFIICNAEGTLKITHCAIIFKTNNTIESFVVVHKLYTRYTTSYIGGYSSNNYTQRIKCVRININDIFVFHSANSSSHMYCTQILFDGAHKMYFIDDYTPILQGNESTEALSMLVDETTNICRKMDMCLSSYYGYLVGVFSYGSNLKLGGITIQTVAGWSNGVFGFIDSENDADDFVYTKFADNIEEDPSNINGYSLTTSNKDKFIFKIDE